MRQCESNSDSVLLTLVVYRVQHLFFIWSIAVLFSVYNVACETAPEYIILALSIYFCSVVDA